MSIVVTAITMDIQYIQPSVYTDFKFYLQFLFFSEKSICECVYGPQKWSPDISQHIDCSDITALCQPLMIPLQTQRGDGDKSRNGGNLQNEV